MGRTPLVLRINNNTKNHTRPPITMAFGGIALKSVSLFFRAIEFGCAAVIIGIFSYYLATLTDHSLPISVHIKAAEGISGAAVLYTLSALVLVCCLGGIAFFSALGMVLDFAFCGAFAYIAWVNRHATDGSCSGFVRTAYGNGYTNLDNDVVGGDGGVTILPSLELLADSRRLLSPSQLSDASSSSSPSSSNSSSSTVARSAPLVHPQTTGTPPALPSASSGNASQRTGLMPTRMPIRSQHTLPRLTCARATLLIRLLLVVSRQSTSMVMRPRMEMRL